MNEIIKNIEKWAEEKNIHEAQNLQPQLLSMVEEVGEVAECIRKGRTIGELESEIGDVAITAIILALQAGTSIEECLSVAYEKIKNRTGKKINGTFVKDSKYPFILSSDSKDLPF